MGRRPRIDSDGAWHHVMNRGSGRRIVFADDADRRLFLGLLGEAAERTGLETHSYCLMGNHFHLLVRSANVSLSDAMKYVSSSYTRRVNAARGVDGPIFRGRFHSVAVREVEHLQQLCRYIHRNPVEAGLVAAARDYRWSSLRALLGDRRAPAFLHTSTVLGWFGGRTERLLEYVEDGERADPDGTSICEDAVDEAPGSDDLTRCGIGWDLLEHWVEAEFGCAVGSIRSSTAGSLNLARLGMMLVAVDSLRVPAPEVAEALGVAAPTVRSGVGRARRRQVNDPSFAAAIAAVEGRLEQRAA